MSPRRGTSHSGNGGVGGRELQALLDSAVVQIADKDDAAGQIPWRTSRRLQEATFRSLVKEREIDNPVPLKKEQEIENPAAPIKKENSSQEALSVRSLKRHRSPSSPTTPLELCQSGETDDGEGNGDSSVNEDSARKGIIVCGELGSRRRKKRTVHFANPLVYYIEDKIQEESISKPPEKKSAEGTGIENKSPSKLGSGTRTKPKLPMSCFDLHCKYSGAKGWRCYRSCIEGESYCYVHLLSRKAASPSIVRISVCT